MPSNKKMVRVLQLELGLENKEVNKGEVLFKCPFCHHRKLKLSINLDPSKSQFGYWKCWVCGQAGKSLWTLLGRTGMSSHTKHELKRGLKQVNRLRPRQPEASESDKKNKECVSLPQSYKPLWRICDGSMQYRYAMNYLKKRGVGMGEIIKYRLGWCTSGRYENRIIIPSYDEEGSLNYFTARDYLNRGWMKYMNPDVSRDIVPFEDITNWTQPVILTEGPFDAIAARRNAIPLFGKSMSASLKRKLFQYKPPAIYILLDQDALSGAVKISEWAMNQDIDTYLVEITSGKDPGEMKFQDIVEDLNNTERLDFKKLVQYKLSV